MRMGLGSHGVRESSASITHQVFQVCKLPQCAHMCGIFLVLKILLCVKFCFQFPLAQKNGTYQQVWTLFDTKHGKKECAQQLFKQGYDLNPRDPMLLQAHSLCLSMSVPTLGMTFLLSKYVPLIAALESKSQFQFQGWRPRLEGNQEQGKSLTTIDSPCSQCANIAQTLR
jgi:hypothetical protein